MLIKAIALALSAAVSSEVAVTTHEMLSGTKEPALEAIGDRAMPLDENIDLRKAAVNPEQSQAFIKAALEKNPYHTANWIALSVNDEASGNLEAVKHDLAEATAHDAGAAPRWAAANFYFRQGDAKEFLTWVNSYRSVTHAEEPGLFRMVAEHSADTHELLGSMPDLGCDELGTLLDTIREHNMGPDELVDRMNISCHDADSGKALAHYMSNLLRADKTDLAKEVKLRIGESDPIENATFSNPVSGEGFDWRVNVNGGVQVSQEKKEGIQFQFEDRVPSGTVLIFQPIALTPGGKYRLSMNLDSEPHQDQAFRWELVELSTGRHLASGLDDDNINLIPAWKFQMPQTDKTLALALFYKREDGEVPFQGTINVQGVRLARELALDQQASLKMPK